MLQVTSVTLTYKSFFFNVGISRYYRVSLTTGNIFKKIKYGNNGSMYGDIIRALHEKTFFGCQLAPEIGFFFGHQ